MGAFDSELYALGIRTRRIRVSPESPKKEDKLLYVSWNGTNGGATGRHFDTEEDAIFFAQGMSGPCMGTHLWFKPSTKEPRHAIRHTGGEEMSRTYCHTHSKYDCPTCADEILSLGIQADKDRIAALEREIDRLQSRIAMTEVPEGFVMVPVEPTQEMLKAGERGIGVSSYVRKGMTIREYRFFKSGWDAMLAASPELKK